MPGAARPPQRRRRTLGDATPGITGSDAAAHCARGRHPGDGLGRAHGSVAAMNRVPHAPSPRALLQTAAVSSVCPHMVWAGRDDLTEAQWRGLEPHLPPEKPRTGRPSEDHRHILNGIFWVLRTGAPWHDLPGRYGPVGTVSSRFYRWACVRRVGAGPLGAAGGGGRARRGGLGPALRGRQRHPRPPARSRRPPGRRRQGGVRRSPERRWAAAAAGSRPSCTCAPKARAGRSRRR